MRDVFEYFPGGKSGVKKRFSDQIRRSLSSLRVGELIELERQLGFPEGKLGKLARGTDDIINQEVIEQLADTCDIDVPLCFGDVDPCIAQDEEEWSRIADEQSFVCVGGADCVSWSKSDRVRWFVLLCALRTL